MTPRSILVGDFPLLHDYSVAFNQRLQNYKFRKLSTNLAVACWPRSTLCLGIARGWQTTLADCRSDLRGISKLDAILEWLLNFSDCWVETRLFGTMLRFEQLGALDRTLHELPRFSHMLVSYLQALQCYVACSTHCRLRNGDFASQRLPPNLER